MIPAWTLDTFNLVGAPARPWRPRFRAASRREHRCLGTLPAVSPSSSCWPRFPREPGPPRLVPLRTVGHNSALCGIGSWNFSRRMGARSIPTESSALGAASQGKKDARSPRAASAPRRPPTWITAARWIRVAAAANSRRTHREGRRGLSRFSFSSPGRVKLRCGFSRAF
jgi:hypothetical protein